jgi:hypothetical protein
VIGSARDNSARHDGTQPSSRLRWSLLFLVLVAAFACAPLAASSSFAAGGAHASRDRAVQQRGHLTTLQSVGISETNQPRAPKRSVTALFVACTVLVAAFAIRRPAGARAHVGRVPTQVALRVPRRGPPTLQIAG